MSAKTGCFALLLSVFLSLPALAADIETCKIDGTISLTEDTTFTCWDDSQNLILAKGGQIIRNGFYATFRSQRGIVEQGSKIDSFVGEYPEHLNGKDAGVVEFEAEWIAGACEYNHNDGYKNGSGGTTVYKVLSFNNPQHGPYKCKDMTVAGIGQGQAGSIIAFADSGRIPFLDFAVHVMN